MMKNVPKQNVSIQPDERCLQPISQEELSTAYGCDGSNWMFGNRHCCKHDCAGWFKRRASAIFNSNS